MKKRRQHHVWQRYLKSWTVADKLFCRMGDKVFQTSTVNVAQDRDFYKIGKLSAAEIGFILALASKSAHPIAQELHQEFLANISAPIILFDRLRPTLTDAADEELDRYMTNVLEDLHARIEGNFQPLLQQITSGDISFYPEDAACVNFFNFVSMQYMRTKAIKERVIARNSEANLPDITRIWPFLSFLFSTNIGGSLYLERKTRQLGLLRNDTQVAFITGDQPMINLLGNGISPPAELSIYYPVSPQLALILSEVRKEPIFTTETLTAAHVTQLNVRIAAASHSQIFGHSREALHAL